MNWKSIEESTRHVKDVSRAETDITGRSYDEIKEMIKERRGLYSTRWEQCDRSFRMLFTALNIDNHHPEDSFDIILSRETTGSTTIETRGRLWRDREQGTFNLKPYTVQDAIKNYEFATETFGSTYEYRYGTHYSHGAKLAVNHDGVEPKIELVRVDGYQVDDPVAKAAIYLSALDHGVNPRLEATEDTLTVIYQSLLDDDLNPEYAAKLRRQYS